MKQGFVQKASEKLADMAECVISQSASLMYWGEVELPECMRTKDCEEENEKNEK